MALDPSSSAKRSAKVKVPISAYIMAVISAVFVTFGLILVVACSGVIVGDWMSSTPRWLLFMIPIFAIALGVLSGWQTVKQAKRKAIKKQAKSSNDDQTVCQICGEAVMGDGNTCPMCGGVQSKSDG